MTTIIIYNDVIYSDKAMTKLNELSYDEKIALRKMVIDSRPELKPTIDYIANHQLYDDLNDVFKFNNKFIDCRNSNVSFEGNRVKAIAVAGNLSTILVLTDIANSNDEINIKNIESFIKDNMKVVEELYSVVFGPTGKQQAAKVTNNMHTEIALICEDFNYVIHPRNYFEADSEYIYTEFSKDKSITMGSGPMRNNFEYKGDNLYRGNHDNFYSDKQFNSVEEIIDYYNQCLEKDELSGGDLVILDTNI